MYCIHCYTCIYIHSRCPGEKLIKSQSANKIIRSVSAHKTFEPASTSWQPIGSQLHQQAPSAQPRSHGNTPSPVCDGSLVRIPPPPVNERSSGDRHNGGRGHRHSTGERGGKREFVRLPLKTNNKLFSFRHFFFTDENKTKIKNKYTDNFIIK